MELPLSRALGRDRVARRRSSGCADDDAAAVARRRRVAPRPTPPRCRRTADEAVRVLYGTHWHQLVRLATLLTRDASVAEELVQDAFVSLHRRWSSLADPAAAHGYLRTTVINNARSVLRHRGSRSATANRGRPSRRARRSGPSRPPRTPG